MEWQVLERTNVNRGDWVPSPGLSNIPKELGQQAMETVARQNGLLGWAKYMVVTQAEPLPGITRQWRKRNAN